jgi:integrase/recombinase XerD
MSDPSRVRVSGPLEPFAAGFAAELQRQGYTPGSACQQMYLFAHLSRWLAGERLDAHALEAATIERFAATRRAAGYVPYTSAKALRPLLAHLRGLGAAPAALVAGAGTGTAAAGVGGGAVGALPALSDR